MKLIYSAISILLSLPILTGGLFYPFAPLLNPTQKKGANVPSALRSQNLGDSVILSP